MPDNRQLGIYWGNNALYGIVSDGTTPHNKFQIPLSDNIKAHIMDGPLSPGGMELISSLQNTLRKQKISNSVINLSLNTKDIIFRSFVIPWMQDYEIPNVVEFEASKYVPFSLEELTFAYHSITVTENNNKKLRIIFVAIKKDVLENYTSYFKEAAIQTTLIEPAALSLIRTLRSKDLIPSNETVALIEKEEVGRIIVVDNGIPQFVREFYLSDEPPSEQVTSKNSEDDIKKLTKEVRISLDYFNRQNEQLQVKRIFVLASSNLNELSKILEENLNIQVVGIDNQSIFGDTTETEIGFLNAYGTSIAASISGPIHFNFIQQNSVAIVKPKMSAPKKTINFKSIIKTALICGPLLIGAIFLSNTRTQKFKKEVVTLKADLGEFQDTDISFIEQKEITLSTRLLHFEKIRTESNITEFLVTIPETLPEGTWIDKLSIIYDDPTIETTAPKKIKKKTTPNQPQTKPIFTMNIEGYAFSENKNNQFRLINTLLKNLKDNATFADYFDDIDLETTMAQNLNDHSVTSFKIVCTLLNEPKRSK